MGRKSSCCALLRLKLFSLKPKKAQWFIVGALTLVAMMAAVALGKDQVQIGQKIEPWQKYVFENFMSESANAINAMVQENATSRNIEERSRDYLDFLRNFGDAHGINASSYFIVGLPTGNDVNVSVINFARNELQSVAISLNGTMQTISSISDRNSATTVFANMPDYFTVNYSITDVTATGGQETENNSFTTSKRVFLIVKMRVASKDGSSVWQNVEFN